MSNTNEDYLDKDPELRDQKYVCLSILTNGSIKDNDGNPVKSDNTARGIKIRGIYSTIEQAQKRAEQIRAFDPHFNIFIGEVGTWLSWDDDIDKAEDAVYAEEKLNTLMKEYKNQQLKAKEYQETRKKTDLENSKKLAEEEKSKREKNEISITNREPSIAAAEEINSSDDNNVVDIKELEKDVIKDKEGLSDYKTEILDKSKKVTDYTVELEKAKKLFEELKKQERI
jgi:hypothetical protein